MKNFFVPLSIWTGNSTFISLSILRILESFSFGRFIFSAALIIVRFEVSSVIYDLGKVYF